MFKRKILNGAILAFAAVALTGCLESTSPQTPALYTNLGAGNVSVDPQEALSMLNAYRLRNGLNALALSDKLSQAAQEEADAMARAEKVSHALSKDLTLPKRLERAGYDAAIATENISAGYWTLAEAFSGWRDSKRHNENMLREGVTEMGIATQFRGDAKYKVFWSMVLAKPDENPQNNGPLTQTLPSALFAR